MSTGSDLLSAYASFAHPDGVALYGSQTALRTLANLLRQSGSFDLAMGAPPAEATEEGPVRAIRIVDASSEEPVVIRRSDGIVEIVGGLPARRRLADALDNLAQLTDRLGGPVRPHVDLEYFPGHGFLTEDSMWMTASLIAEPDR